MIRNLSGWSAASAVRIGKLWVPGRNTEKTLGKYTKQIFCLNGHEQYPYSYLGSASAVRFGEKCFILWCQHQTKGYSPNDVTIPIEGGKTLISGSTHHVVTEDESNADEDYKDLCAMQFVPDNYRSPNLEAAFFPLHEQDAWRGNRDTRFQVFGFPTELRRVDYEQPHVHVGQVTTSADYGQASNARYLHSLDITGKQSFDADGMSGGPVYHVAQDREGFYIGLAGVTVRGNRQHMHFIDVRFILSLLKSA